MKTSVIAGVLNSVLLVTAMAAEPEVAAISPNVSTPGLVRTVLVEGKELTAVVKVRLFREGAPALTFDVKSDGAAPGTRLKGELAIPEAATPGAYNIQYSTGGDTFADTKLVFSIVHSNEQYVECPLTATAGGEGSGLFRVGRGVACTQSLLDRKEASDIFGKRISDMYLVVQINIRNLNEEFNYLLHDVGLIVTTSSGGEPVLVASRTKRLVRGVAEKGQAYDTRNVIISLVRGAGTILGGIAATPYATKAFSQAVNVFQGPFTSALTAQVPDFTINQLNRLNDHGFDTNSIVVPKGASATAVAFLSQRMFLDHKERDEFIQRGRWDEDKSTREALVKFQRRIRLALAGFHVRRVDLDEPALSAIDPSTLLKSGTVAALALRGAHLDQVAKIRIRTANGMAREADVKLVDPLDTTRATASLKPDIDAGGYNVYLVLANGAEKPTSLSFSVGTEQPAISGVSVPRLAMGSSAPIRFTVSRGDLIKQIEAVQNDNSDPGIAIEWQKAEIDEWSGSVKTGSTAQLGEHVWRIQTKDGAVVKTARSVTVAPPDPGPSLARVSVTEIKVGGPELAIVFEGERLTGVTFEARQNDEADPGVSVKIESQSDKQISGKIKAADGAALGSHVWWIKTATGAAKTAQRLGVAK